MRYISRTEIERGKAERRDREAVAKDAAGHRKGERLAEAIRRNRHNFGQLRAAGFPGVHPVEVLSWTGIRPIARLLEIVLRYDVEYGEGDTRHQLVRRQRMLGYHMEPPSFGNTQDWNGTPVTTYDSGLVLTTEGSVHPVSRNALDTRGCLIVDVGDLYPTLGTVEDPATLPREFPHHLYELTLQTLHEAGVEYRPLPDLQADDTAGAD